MISIFLKDSVLTTQSRTDIIDLKSKMKKKNLKNLVSRNVIVEFGSKGRAFPAWCCTKQTKLEDSNFLKWASIAPTESCVTYLPSNGPS